MACAVETWPSSGGTLVTQYIYDAEGNRVAKGTASLVTVNGQSALSCDTTKNNFTPTNSYVLGPSNEQLTETDGNGNWIHSNVYAAGMLIATYDTAPTGDPALHFQLADWLGTRRVQTDQFGNPEESWVSLPFGDGLAALPAPGAPPTADDATEHHFTGKERDTESGNHYFGARYYASSMGRFMSPDNGVDFNTSDPQSWNLYSYVRNNPLTRIDPNGRTTVIIPGTGWSANDWTTNMKMANEARQEFHDPDVRILNWDGGYNPSSRAAGAQALRDIAATVPADQKLNVISHSRGGDVALDATHGISHKIDNLITLAMPNYSTEPPDTANIGLWINVTTFEDWVQKAAGDNGAPSGALNLTLHAPGYSHIGAHSAIWQNDGLRYQWWSFWSQHSGCHSSVTTDKVGGGTETTCAD